MTFFRNPSLTPNSVTEGTSKEKSFVEYMTSNLNWLYEHSPVNFSTITGWRHPSMQRVIGRNPLCGRAGNVAKDTTAFAEEIKKLAKAAEKDPRGRAYCNFGPSATVLLTRPEDIAQAYLQDANNDKADRGKLLKPFNKIFGDNNLFNIETNETWETKRKKLEDFVFQPRSLAELVRPMQEIVDEFIDEIHKQGEIKSLEIHMMRFAMEVFARAGLNTTERLGDRAQAISDGFDKALAASSLPINTVWLHLDTALKYMGLSAGRFLDKERDDLKKVIRENFFEQHKDDLLTNRTILMEEQLRDTDPDVLFENTVSDIGLSLLAGHETTARLLQFAVILLAKNPEVLAKLREEIASNRPNSDTWSYADLDKMIYLQKILKETLRLYPPLPVMPRLLTEKMTLAAIPFCETKEEYDIAMAKRDVTQDVELAVGTCVDIAPWITHRLPNLYPNPTVFNPDRYKSASFDSTDKCTWFPFGIGKRNCSGRRLAMTEAKLYLIKFVELFDFQPTCLQGKELLAATMNGTLRHDGPVSLKITERSNVVVDEKPNPTLRHR